MTPHRSNPRLRRSAAGFTLVELLLALTISVTLLAAVALALNASFMSYATTSETASIQVAGRQVMQRMLGFIRSGRLHDAYDPANGALTLLPPSLPPLRSVGIQMIDRNDQLVRIWWAFNISYATPNLGDLWMQVDNNTAQILLNRVEAQVDPLTDAPYVFSLRSRDSEGGRLLQLANVDLNIRPDPQAVTQMEATAGKSAAVRLIGSAQPRRNIDN